MPPKNGGKKKTASGYKMPEHLPVGTTLTDLHKKQWTLGKSIGAGGFGEIYLASEGTRPEGDSANYVVKIEPKENGPIFVEMHFYLQVGSPDLVKGWGTPVNMPLLHGHGSYKHKEDTYRFLVIDRFGVDLGKSFANGKNVFSDEMVGTLAVQIINTLEYIHSKGYTHNDVKAANLLLGLGKNSGNIYLVDFGLCVKYMKPDGHKEYKADPRKANDGTIEYLSRDAHIGCTSRRSDLEVLCYNLYHWSTGSLPWISLISSPAKVEAAKEKFMSEVPGNLKDLPSSVQQLIIYVMNLKFQEKPDYNKCRGFFRAEMKSSGGKVQISQKQSPKKKTPSKAKPAARAKRKSYAEESTEEESEDEFFSPSPQPKLSGTPKVGRGTPGGKGTPKRTPAGVRSARSVASKPVRKTLAREDSRDEDKVPRSAKKYREAGCQTSPGFVAKASTGKKAGRTASNNDEQTQPKKPAKSNAKRKPPRDESCDNEFGIENPTPAMLEIMRRKKELEAEKLAKKRKK